MTDRSVAMLAAAFAAAVLVSVAPSPVQADGFVGETGEVWAKIGYRNWHADRTFAGPADAVGDTELGDRIAFDSITGGELTLRALELQAEYVPVPGLVVGGYFPAVQFVRFRNTNFVSRTLGTGDIRSYVGYQITPAGADAATTLYLRPKIPTTGIDKDSLAVPLSEGQFDLGFEQVTSWRPIPRLQITGATMFRYRFPGRFPASGAQYKPGNEMVARFVVGGRPVETLWVKAGIEGLWSTGWENREPPGPSRSTFRSYQRVTGGIYWSWGRLVGGAARGFALDVSGNWPFSGRDYPVGPTWAAAVAWSGPE